MRARWDPHLFPISLERQRLRRLHALKGWKGRWMRLYDASQAWLLVGAVGMCASPVLFRPWALGVRLFSR